MSLHKNTKSLNSWINTQTPQYIIYELLEKVTKIKICDLLINKFSYDKFLQNNYIQYLDLLQWEKLELEMSESEADIVQKTITLLQTQERINQEIMMLYDNQQSERDKLFNQFITSLNKIKMTERKNFGPIWEAYLETTPICPISQDHITFPYLTECEHLFEYESIAKWLKTNNSCPVCRKNIAIV